MAKRKRKSSKSDSNFLNIGQYKVAKNKKTKYIELGVSPKASKEEKALMKKVIALLGSNILFVNLFDNDFRDEYDIPDFVKGSISVNLDSDEDEDEDEDDEEDEEDEEDEPPRKKKAKSKRKAKKTSRKKVEDEDDEEEDEDEDDDIPY